MANHSQQIVQKLWNYSNVLRDDLSACNAQADRMSYLLARCAQASGDYPSARLRAGVEQLTYLLFIKMADERTKPPYLPACLPPAQATNRPALFPTSTVGRACSRKTATTCLCLSVR
jgi:hypothetical protein